jgi:hypothetical protein
MKRDSRITLHKILYYVGLMANVGAYIFAYYLIFVVRHHFALSLFTFSSIGLSYYARKRIIIPLLILIIALTVIYLSGNFNPYK